MSSLRLAVAALLFANVLTAMGIVYTKHKSRMQFRDMRTVQVAIDDANTEWGRLQIEESTLARFGRIEELASDKLQMRMPAQSEIKMVVE